MSNLAPSPSNASIPSPSDEGDTNELAMTAIYIVLYLVPLIVLCILIHRKRLQSFGSKASKAVSSRLLAVLCLFLSICILRMVMAVMSLMYRFGEESFVVEAISNFWLPYFIMNIEFAAISVILMIWVGILKASSNDEKQLKRRPFRIALISLNVILNVATILALSIISPFGDSEPRLQSNIDLYESLHGAVRKFNFRVSYFAIATALFTVAIGLFIVIYFKLRASLDESEDSNETRSSKKRSFLKKTEGFIIAILVLFLLRLILDVMIVFMTMGELMLRTVQFIWHSVPEIALICTFIWVAWVKRNEAGDEQMTKKTAGETIDQTDPQKGESCESEESDPSNGSTAGNCNL